MVGRILGQGGFGITYIGWDIALEKKVAIKEYYPSGQVGRTPGTNTLSWYTSESAALARQTGLEMFLKEARKMSKVDDIPGIVRVRDLFQENQTAYIVMDFVEGETLKARLQKTGPLPWSQAKDIFAPAIRAMERVHKAGLIHRDLSPDNLMLTPDGQVKVLDLGAAKDLNINSGASSMQVAKGGFSPFEQYSQRGGSGPWTDVYAMAATIYYTLTGVLPPAAIDRVEEDTMDWGLVSALPGQAREALMDAMAVSARKRTQSMEELERGLFGGPTQEPSPAPKPKPEKKAAPKPKAEKKARKTGWIAAVAAVVVVVACGVGLGTKAGKNSTAPTETQKLMETETETTAEAHNEATVIPATVADSQHTGIVSGTRQATTIAAGNGYSIGVHNDGTVVLAGNIDGEKDLSSWHDIVAVAAGDYHAIGLRSDGTVVAIGYNEGDQCDTSSWRNIVAVDAGFAHTVGLCSDGKVVAVGEKYFDYGSCNVNGWSNIIAVAAGKFHTVGLRSDGTVVATGYNDDGECDVSDWTDIVAISAGNFHTVGLRSDGTVVATGFKPGGQCDVSNWNDIVAVSAGAGLTVGLHSDGTVIATGTAYGSEADIGDLNDIVAVTTGYDLTLGLRNDGSVCARGLNDRGQCNVSTWTNIRTP